MNIPTQPPEAPLQWEVVLADGTMRATADEDEARMWLAVELAAGDDARLVHRCDPPAHDEYPGRAAYAQWHADRVMEGYGRAGQLIAEAWLA